MHLFITFDIGTNVEMSKVDWHGWLLLIKQASHDDNTDCLLTYKQSGTHGCVINTLVTDMMLLNHKPIIISTDLILILYCTSFMQKYRIYNE